jgi:hypothetical protein
VNAIAKEIGEEPVSDPAEAITVERIQEAKESLIRWQDTHLDSLGKRLREPRVRDIIESMVVGRIFGKPPMLIAN